MRSTFRSLLLGPLSVHSPARWRCSQDESQLSRIAQNWTGRPSPPCDNYRMCDSTHACISPNRGPPRRTYRDFCGFIISSFRNRAIHTRCPIDVQIGDWKRTATGQKVRWYRRLGRPCSRGSQGSPREREPIPTFLIWTSRQVQLPTRYSNRNLLAVCLR